MLSVLASQLDSLGFLAPCLLKGKLILQNVTTLGYDRDDILPDDVLREWNDWVVTKESYDECAVPRCSFSGGPERVQNRRMVYQLHGFHLILLWLVLYT